MAQFFFWEAKTNANILFGFCIHLALKKASQTKSWYFPKPQQSLVLHCLDSPPNYTFWINEKKSWIVQTLFSFSLNGLHLFIFFHHFFHLYLTQKPLHTKTLHVLYRNQVFGFCLGNFSCQTLNILDWVFPNSPTPPSTLLYIFRSVFQAFQSLRSTLQIKSECCNTYLTFPMWIEPQEVEVHFFWNILVV